MPPLLPALAYATGDLSLLRDDLRPDPLLVGHAPGRADRRRSRRGPGELAFDALVRFRDGGSRPAPPPPDEDLLRIMEFAVGGADMDAVPAAARGGAGLPGRGPPGARLAQVDDVAPDTDFRVRGRSAPACRACSPPTGCSRPASRSSIVEKNDDVGGTWFENSYPGCRVDNPNHNYSYSFAQRHDWPLHFSTQDVLLDYFRRCADAFGLRRAHPLRHRGRRRRRGPTTDQRWTRAPCARPTAREEVARGRRRRQRGRAS